MMLVLGNALRNDTKVQYVESLGEEIVIGQLELWNGKGFMDLHLPVVAKSMKEFKNPLFFFTSPSISEGVNYLYYESDLLKEKLSKKIGAVFS